MNDYEDFWGVEDFLQEQKVFINGIDRKPAHHDSYGTIVHFNRLDKVIENNNFSEDLLEDCFDYWDNNSNVGKPLKLVSVIWKDHLKNQKKN